MQRLIGIFLLLLTGDALSAQRFVLETDTREVVTGARFEIRYVLHDAVADRFIPPQTITGFRVIMGPNELRSSGFQNGQTYRFQSWTYVLEAIRPGRFTLPEAAVRVHGSTLTCKPLPIQVNNARADRQPAFPDANTEVFMQAEIEPAAVYLGQQAIYRILLYSRLNVADASLLETADFKGHYTRELQRFDTRTQQLQWKNKPYIVRTLYEQALFPQHTGTDTIGPTRIQVSVEQPSRFPGLSIPTPVTLQTQPVVLTVKPLPEPIPDAFCGGVGQFVLEASLSADNVPAQEAALLTLTLRGNGDAKRLHMPRLQATDGLEILDPTVLEQEDYENGEELVHTRTLQYVLTAKTPGRYGLLPAITYFDPDSNRYLTRAIRDSLFLTVGPPVPGTLPDSLALQPQPIRNWWTAWPAWSIAGSVGMVLLLLLGVLGFYAWQRRRKKTTVNPPQNASGVAWTQAQHLVHAPAPAFCAALLEAIQMQLSDRLRIPLANLNKTTVQAALNAHPAGKTLSPELLAFWERCDMVAYGGMPAWDTPENIWQKAQQLKKQLQEL